VEYPANIDRPFFAYGLFRPGQLAFFQLREFVSTVIDPARVSGTLLLRDGLPIIDPSPKGIVKGALVKFRDECAEQAYKRISDMEPDKHYRWDESRVNGTLANVLVGRSPKKGSVPCEADEWSGWDDPLFKEALDVVEETLSSQEFDWNLRALFRLQMAYLLLWSSIERYVSLRYHLGNQVRKKIRQLAHEPSFAESLGQNVKESRRIYRADRPGESEFLDPESPEKAIHYYYQVRSNITHRGKGVVRDFELLKMSLAELLPIFRDVLNAAKNDAAWVY
jgi:hypothetical protein